MRVMVRLPSALRADCGGLTLLEAELSDSATLADLFTALAAGYPRLERRVRTEQGELRRYVNVFVEGEESRRRGGLAAPLHDGDEVHIIQSVAGG